MVQAMFVQENEEIVVCLKASEIAEVIWPSHLYHSAESL